MADALQHWGAQRFKRQLKWDATVDPEDISVSLELQCDVGVHVDRIADPHIAVTIHYGSQTTFYRVTAVRSWVLYVAELYRNESS
jgi:hypothetical protein